MSATSVFQFLQRSAALRRYRTMLHQHIRHEPAISLVPGLLDLPLWSSEEVRLNMASLFTHSPFIALHGTAGSGRSLLLLQLAYQWATSNRSEPVFYMPLARNDVSDLPPHAIFVETFETTGLPSPLEHSYEDEGHQRPWLLLFDEWEALPAARRATWQDFVVGLRRTVSPESQIVVALPEDSTDWQGFQSVLLAAPDDMHIQAWLSHLLPNHDPEPILTALQPQAELASLRQRLLEVVLLALVYPTHGLPATRVQLYEWVYAIDQQRMQQNNRLGVGAGAWKIATARKLPIPSSRMPSTIEEDRRSFDIGHTSLRCYEMATALAAADNFNPLDTMEPHMKAEVALLLAGMLPDPTRFYAYLWGNGQVPPEHLLMLGRCVQEYPTAPPDWKLRVFEALSHHRQSVPHFQLLETLAPELPAVLVAASESFTDEQAASWLQDFARIIGVSPLLALVGDPAARPALRWAAGDALLHLPAGTRYAALADTAPADTLSQAILCYVLALGDAESRSFLTETDALAWIEALEQVPIEQERLTRVVSTLLNDERIPATVRTRLLAFIPQNGIQKQQHVQGMLIQACTSNVESVRHTAFATLQHQSPQQALLTLAKILLHPDCAWEAQHDALEQLSSYPQNEASVLLTRCAMADHLPLAGRLRALVLLASRKGVGPALLRRLMNTPHVHTLVRAAAIRLLVQRGYTGIYADLCQLVVNDPTLLIRQTALAGLGGIGQRIPEQSEQRAAILTLLYTILQRETGNAPLVISALHALSHLGNADSVMPLRTLLNLDLSYYVRTTWVKDIPQLEEIPAHQWHDLSLPPEVHSTLLTAMTEGGTEADQPGSFGELIAWQAMCMRMAAAEALAHIAPRVDATTRQDIRTSLLALVQQTQTLPSQEASHLLHCLVRASSDGGLQDMGFLLATPTLHPSLRWLVVEQLSQHAGALPLLLSSLEQAVSDPFTRGKLVYTLGSHTISDALPLIRHLAEQRDGDLYVRMQAIAALGCYADPAVETTLLHIVADVTNTPDIRGAAAAALPADLRAEMRRWLYELLRRERQPTELIAGVLQTLGRNRDREALGLLLHYTQSEQPVLALTALTALAELGDSGVVPNIVRITQNKTRDANVRLQAVGVLLQLGGTEYLSLLRDYLDSDDLSIRLQAFEYLMEFRPEDSRLLFLVTHKTAPMALRLRAVEALAQRSDDHGTLCNLLLDASEYLHLRITTASILAHTPYADAIPTLTRCVRHARTPSLLRRRCIAALVEQSRKTAFMVSAAQFALGQLAEAPDVPDEGRTWAAQALIELLP